MADGPSSTEMSWGIRLLIMAYALGIVLIGAYPIQQEHGSLLAYIQAQTQQILEISTKSRAQNQTARGRLRAPAPRVLSASKSDPMIAPEQEHDRLSAEDRKALNQLIDDL